MQYFSPLKSIPYAETSRDYVCKIPGQRKRSGVPTGGDALESALKYAPLPTMRQGRGRRMKKSCQLETTYSAKYNVYIPNNL